MSGLHLFGVRHHGPGSARSLRKALDQCRPDIVLVELPADTDAVLAWSWNPAMVPPVALLGHAVNRPERATFLPLAEFSPEWQALRWAAAQDVPVQAIDLPLAVSLAAEPDAADQGARGDPLALMAAADGDTDAERWWDDLVEHRGDGEPAFAAIGDLMAAVRHGTPTGERDELREAHMRVGIRAATRLHATCAVVCGAWHVPALDPTATTATADQRTLRGRPRVKVATSWVPWTHRRLAAATGYRAGVASPGWYRHVYEHPGPDATIRFLVDAARMSRQHGADISPDHLIAASRLADALATMRRRPRAGLEEVLDATEAVMGNAAVVRAELVVGDAIGEVPAGSPQVPLARDLAVQQRRARLKPTAGARTVELDLRTPTARARSTLLHRLVALEVPWGTLQEGRRSSGTFRETWLVDWEPELSIRVVEQSAHGTTVQGAATRCLTERAEGAGGLADLVAVLELALLADLPGAVSPTVRGLNEQAAHAADAASLIDALAPLARATQYGDVRGTDLPALREVLDGLIARVLVGLGPACSSLDSAAAEAMVERLSELQAALALVDHPARHSELPAVLASLAAHAGHGLVQGRATRLLHDAEHWDATTTQLRFSRALSGGTPASTGASFVEGFLAGSGTVLLHDTDLLQIVDRWLCTLGAESFTSTVALLRRTFGAFEPAERRQLGWLVSGSVAPEPARYGADVDEARAAASLRTVRLLLGLPVDG